MKLLSVEVSKKHSLGFFALMLVLLLQPFADVYVAINTGYLVGLGTVVYIHGDIGIAQLIQMGFKLVTLVTPLYFLTLGCNVVEKKRNSDTYEKVK